MKLRSVSLSDQREEWLSVIELVLYCSTVKMHCICFKIFLLILILTFGLNCILSQPGFLVLVYFLIGVGHRADLYRKMEHHFDNK